MVLALDGQVMLKITTKPDSEGDLVKLEGAIREAWLDEVRKVVALKRGQTKRRLDLSDVTFADASGIALLKELIDQGCEVEASSGFIAAALGLEIK